MLLTGGQLVRADAITIFNTGVNASGTPLADGTIGDPHYSLVGTPGGTSTIRVRTSAGGFPIPPWIGNNSTSAWIGPNNDPSLDGPQGHYDYQTKFTLPSNALLSSASITGQWAGDNDLIQILLNGVPVPQGNLPAIDPGGGTRPLNTFFPFSITNGFVAGTNTLDFIVNNQPTSNNPTGVRVELSGTFTIPEPSTLALFGLSIASFAGWRRLRRSRFA